jgi:hypothetical protein
MLDNDSSNSEELNLDILGLDGDKVLASGD